jgi:hypothetical protein
VLAIVVLFVIGLVLLLLTLAKQKQLQQNTRLA